MGWLPVPSMLLSAICALWQFSLPPPVHSCGGLWTQLFATTLRLVLWQTPTQSLRRSLELTETAQSGKHGVLCHKVSLWTPHTIQAIMCFRLCGRRPCGCLGQCVA